MRQLLRPPAVAGCAILMLTSVLAGAARPAETVSIALKDAVQMALKANLALRQAANATETSEIAVKRSEMDFFPDVRLSMGASQSYGKSLDTVSDRFEWDHSNSMNLSVSSGLELFSGFGRLAALRQSRLELEAQRKSLARSREQVIYQTIQQFMIVVLDEDVIKVDEENLESQRRELAQIEAFTTSGRRPIVDLYQQQAAVADAESRLLVDRRNREVDRYQLLQILAIEPGADYALVAPDIDAVSAALEGLVGEGALGKAIARRADLASQRLQLEAARKQITVSRSGYWPSLSLSAGAGTGYRSGSLYDFSDQFTDNNLNGSIGLSLSLPIFDRLSTYHSVEQAKVGLRQAQIGLEQLELQVRVDVRQALQDYGTAVKAVEVAQAQLRYSAQALGNMEERYKVGASTLVELMQARASDLQSSYNLIDARYSRVLRGIGVLYYAGEIDSALPLFE
jgi:outer membrane protein